MTWHQEAMTHGGIELMAKSLRAMWDAGWSILDSSENRGELTGEAIIQSNLPAATVPLAGEAIGTWFPLPVCMFTDALFRSPSTPAVEGVDYELDRTRGRIRALAGGLWDAGGGFVVTGEIQMLAGANARAGWVVLRSLGEDYLEDIQIGCRFGRATGGSASNPRLTGPVWCAFSGFAPAVSDFDSVLATSRSPAVSDLEQFIPPTFEGVFHASANRDRAIVHGISAGRAAWAYLGRLDRLRPVVEQPSITAVAGGSGALAGIGADPTYRGPDTDTGVGTLWLYDAVRFAGAGMGLELNANTWTMDPASLAAGLTPSRRVTGGFTYFEAHDLIAARNIEAVNDSTAVLYGLWDGLRSVHKADARHGEQVQIDGESWRLLQACDDPARLVAVKEV